MFLQAAFNSKMRDAINDHPELGELENARNGGSSGPTTNAGTPVASGGGSKLKLTFNANSAFTNGGSSARQSDEDD